MSRPICKVESDTRAFHMKQEDAPEITKDQRDYMRVKLIELNRDELMFDTIMDALAEMPEDARAIFVEAYKMKLNAFVGSSVTKYADEYITPSDSEVDEAIRELEMIHE